MYHIKTMEDYNLEYKRSINDSENFWNEIACNFKWHKKWNQVTTGNFNDLNVKWFTDAKLNITENCLDRHLETNKDKIALLFEPNDPKETVQTFTFKELYDQVNKAANMLKNLGVKKGDRVCLYMGMVPELMISLLACARIGAVHSVIFGGFSAKALSDRINDAEGIILITNDGSFRGKKIVPLKDLADEALKTCPSIKKVIVHKRTKNKINMENGRDLDWTNLMNSCSTEFQPEIMDSEDPLFILYTSGSTGKPKGILHTTAGYMVWAGYSFKNVFQVSDQDIYWCTADIGWITGHSYITYGPLLNGTTTVMFEGVPTYPDASRFWQIIKKHNVTHFYTAPTAIRALMAEDQSYLNSVKLNTLKVLGSVGEPINEEAWNWFNENIGNENCPIVDTWWQTETGGIMISPLAGITKTKPSFATFPLPGILPQIVDENGNEKKGDEIEGNLCIQKPWPGQLRTIWKDHERFKQTYFSTYPGRYFTGDGCLRDAQGNFRITGRVDDVINVSGHRLGTAEIEDAIDTISFVVETAVIGFPHDIKGQGIFAYIVCKEDPSDLMAFEEKVRKKVNELIGPIAKPDKILLVKALPKTRSGKIMRRILRKIAENKFSELGDTSTLLDSNVVENIISRAKESL